MPPTRLIIVRHGETEWNVCGRLQNHLDSPLTSLGLMQAEAIALRMRKVPFDAFYASDLGRAVATADAIARATGREYGLVPAFRERAMGCFEGLTWAEIAVQYPEYHRAHIDDHSVAVPGGESGEQFQRRVADACEELADRHEGQTILVVSHGHVLDIFLRHVLRLPLSQHRPARLPNASFNVFERHDGHWVLACWGDTAHLAELPAGVFP